MKRALAILILLGLAACTPFWTKGEGAEEKFAKCPTVQLLAPARGWIDPAGDNWLTRGEITEYGVECKLTKTNAIVTIKPDIELTRAANLNPKQEAKISLPVFVAVMKDDQIISKNVMNVPVTFPADKTSLEEKDAEVPVTLDFITLPEPPPAADTTAAALDDKDKDKDKKEEKKKDHTTAADRTIIFGFQLNPDQLGYFEKLRSAPFTKVDEPNPQLNPNPQPKLPSP